MESTDLTISRDVRTTLNYHLPLDDKPPYHYALRDPPQGKEKSNFSLVPIQVEVHDARGREDELTLDKAGFQFVTCSSAEKDFDDDERIKAQYYPEVEDLLKSITGAKHIFIFDHIVRRSSETGTGSASSATLKTRGPAEGVHVDQTYEATRKRVSEYFPHEADRLLQSRVRLINVWRPIHHPVAHRPLAVMDWRTLDETRDLVPVRLIMPHREGGMYSVRFHPDHRWYYLSD